MPCQPLETLGREAGKPGSCPCVPARPPAQQPLPACSAGRGRAVGYQPGYFHNGGLRLGGGEEGWEGEGAEEQPQQLALQTRTCSAGGRQPGAGAAAVQRGSPAHGDPGPHPPAPPATLPSRSGQRGFPQPSLAFCFLTLLDLSGWGCGGRVPQAPLSPNQAPGADGKGTGRGGGLSCCP